MASSREDEKRSCRRVLQCLLSFSSLKNFCEKFEIIPVLFWIDRYCDRFFGVYLLQLILLKKMWHAQIFPKCFFSKTEIINFEINSIDASCAAYRDEDVAGRWAKILLPLRGDMFCNSRREIRKIASSTGHDRKNSLLFVCIIWRNLIKYRQISERR